MKFWLLALFSIPAMATADVTVTEIDYHGWSHCFRLSNGTVELVVVPKIGRVMRYGYVGGLNLLWENPDLAGKPPLASGWTNYGGDKMWPAPQSDWNWPPDAQIDGSEWRAETIKDGVRITSPDSTVSKIRIVREITMAAYGSEVRFHNRMDNLGGRHLMGPWQITQLDDPYSVYVPFEPTSQNPKGWRVLVGGPLNASTYTLTTEGIRLSRSSADFKVGAFSKKGEITASKGDTVFHASTKVFARGHYSDGGSPLQVYSNAQAKYVEAELLGPLNPMENEEGALLDVTWRLSKAGS